MESNTYETIHDVMSSEDAWLIVVHSLLRLILEPQTFDLVIAGFIAGCLIGYMIIWADLGLVLRAIRLNQDYNVPLSRSLPVLQPDYLCRLFSNPGLYMIQRLAHVLRKEMNIYKGKTLEIALLNAIERLRGATGDRNCIFIRDMADYDRSRRTGLCRDFTAATATADAYKLLHMISQHIIETTQLDEGIDIPWRVRCFASSGASDLGLAAQKRRCGPIQEAMAAASLIMWTLTWRLSWWDTLSSTTHEAKIRRIILQSRASAPRLSSSYFSQEYRMLSYESRPLERLLHSNHPRTNNGPDISLVDMLLMHHHLFPL